MKKEHDTSNKYYTRGNVNKKLTKTSMIMTMQVQLSPKYDTTIVWCNQYTNIMIAVKSKIILKRLQYLWGGKTEKKNLIFSLEDIV